MSDLDRHIVEDVEEPPPKEDGEHSGARRTPREMIVQLAKKLAAALYYWALLPFLLILGRAALIVWTSSGKYLREIELRGFKAGADDTDGALEPYFEDTQQPLVIVRDDELEGDDEHITVDQPTDDALAEVAPLTPQSRCDKYPNDFPTEAVAHCPLRLTTCVGCLPPRGTDQGAEMNNKVVCSHCQVTPGEPELGLLGQQHFADRTEKKVGVSNKYVDVEHEALGAKDDEDYLYEDILEAYFTGVNSSSPAECTLASREEVIAQEPQTTAADDKNRAGCGSAEVRIDKAIQTCIAKIEEGKARVEFREIQNTTNAMTSAFEEAFSQDSNSDVHRYQHSLQALNHYTVQASKAPTIVTHAKLHLETGKLAEAEAVVAEAEQAANEREKELKNEKV
ncbi:hypothetical protein NMY22_g4666 [Coprinellus aureogranulatus]|nr:hypothetical protein NMY22_g4666 [Coprinellus aureogranulatus]